MKTIKSPFALSWWFGALILLIFATTRDSSAAPTFREVAVFPNGCLFVYGNLQFGGDDFVLKECAGKVVLIKSFDVGFVKQVQIIDNQTAWAVIGNSLAKMTFGVDKVLSIDVRTRSENRYETVYFLNDRIGWAAGYDGLLSKTLDGGLTWVSIPLGTLAHLTHIEFAGDKFGWALHGPENKGELKPGYLETRDGGMTWRVIQSKDVSFSALAFSSENHGCGVVDRDEIRCISDDGQRWNRVKLKAENRTGLFFLDDQTGWHVGSSIMFTKDGGKTWDYSLQSSEPEQRAFQGLNLDDVFFSDKQNGWAWGLSSVYHTSNGGGVWIRISDRWTEAISAIWGSQEKD